MSSGLISLSRGRHFMSRRTESLSPLDSADAAFRLLTSGPQPLSVEGRSIGGSLPGRRIPLDELKRLLLSQSTGTATRDAAWVVLVTRARLDGPSWVIGAVGVGMPGLRRAAGRLACGYRGDPADIDAEVLTGFLTALRSIDVSRPTIAGRLRWSAYRAGAAFRQAESIPSSSNELPLWAAGPSQFRSHPDFVLADAVARDVITAAEAELIGATRLDCVPLTATARDLGVPYDAARMRRSRAEARVAQAIRDGELSDTTWAAN
jgi:hypothetical protein